MPLVDPYPDAPTSGDPHEEARYLLALCERLGVPKHLVHDCRTIDQLATLLARRKRIPHWESYDPLSMWEADERKSVGMIDEDIIVLDAERKRRHKP